MMHTRLCLLLLGCIVLSAPASAQELFEESNDALTKEIERMYVRGLQFLAQGQTTSGGFKDSPYGTSPGVVGFAVIAYLAHGDDPNHGPYSGNIKRGLNFIISKQDKTTGYIGTTMYNHGFATLALAEAYGAVEDERLGPALEKAISLIVSSQKNNPRGGWRYSPDSTDADTTVSGAQMVALFAARNAGLAVPETAIQTGLKYFKSCQTPEGGLATPQTVDPTPRARQLPRWCLRWPRRRTAPRFAKHLDICERRRKARATGSTISIMVRRRFSTPPRRSGASGTAKTSPS